MRQQFPLRSHSPSRLCTIHGRHFYGEPMDLRIRREVDSQPTTTLEHLVFNDRTGWDIATWDGYKWIPKHDKPVDPSKWAPLPIRA